MKNMTNKGVLLSLTFALAAYSQLGAAIDASDLLSNSPFVRAKAAPGQGGAAGSGQQYVFRGVCKIGDDILINISDETAKKTYWIKTDESEADIKVVSYNEEDKKVSILVGSRDYTLELAKPKAPAVDAKSTKAILQPPAPEGKNDIRRIRRVRRTGMIPPPPIDMNSPNLPPGLRGTTGASKRTSTTSGTTSSSSGGSSTNSSDSTNTTNNEVTDSSTSGDTTPPTTVPPSPPSFVPELPDSIRSQIESSNNSSN